MKIMDEKKKAKEDSDKNKKDQENQIDKLNKEYDELNLKMSNYNNEKPKLLTRAREPKKEIDRMISLENELKQLNIEKENTIKSHEEKQKKLKEKSEEENKKKDIEIYHKKILIFQKILMLKKLNKFNELNN